MISVVAEDGVSKRLYALPAFADRLMHDVVQEGIEFGDNYMTSIVPRGASQQLASAVTHTGPITISPGHYVGTVGVDGLIAPYAGEVDKGTGVDGPFHSPVFVQRSARRNPKKLGTMRFEKLGEPARYRHVVKARPSVKIEANKNFSGRTHDAMRDWARIRSGVLSGQIALYLAGSR